MKIDCRLDYSTILANHGRPVHLSVALTAGEAPAQARKRSMAFCVVLDRSGSMAGPPLNQAKAACETVVRNLRSEDEFALVAFDDHAKVVIPLQRICDKSAALSAIREISDRGSTNLTAGWMLGQDELKKTSGDTARRVLLLSDGLLNVGITDPEQVSRIVADGLERGHIRTSTLGFGDQYDETLLERLATSSGGNFYDANSPEKLPAIFSAELEGLQKTAAQNVRLRVRKLTFCEDWQALASYYSVALPDGRTELSLGDLVSEESVTVIFQLEVLPLPLLPDGSPAASLEGEALMELEILWDDLTGGEIKSCVHRQTVRILATQNPEDVKINVDVIPGVAVQRTGKAMEEALREMQAGHSDQALAILREAVRQLQALGQEAQVAASVSRLEALIRQIEENGTLDARSSKALRFTSSHMRRSKSHSLWTIDEQAPGYSQRSIPPPSSGKPPGDTPAKDQEEPPV